MRKDQEGRVYTPFRIRPDRDLAAKYLGSQQASVDLDEVPPTYMIFLRGETRGVNLFQDLEIPRARALHGGQRYEWFAPMVWDEDLDVTVTVKTVTEKVGRNGTLWFGNIEFDYRRTGDGELVLRETTRLIERG